MNDEELAEIERYWTSSPTWALERVPALLAEVKALKLQVGELQKERDNWVESARVYAQNVDFWRGKVEAMEPQVRQQKDDIKELKAWMATAEEKLEDKRVELRQGRAIEDALQKERDDALRLNERLQNALREIRAKLERSHDGGCILPLRDMVNDALGEGVMLKRQVLLPDGSCPCRMEGEVLMACERHAIKRVDAKEQPRVSPGGDQVWKESKPEPETCRWCDQVHCNCESRG